MRIAVFCTTAVPTMPSGDLMLQVIRSLCHEHDFTVFACKFDNPCPERIEFVRVLSPPNVPIIYSLLFHFMAIVSYLIYRLRRHGQFDLIQITELSVVFGDICAAHFCHRAFIKYHWKHSRAKGFRGYFRWVSHTISAIFESWIFRQVRWIVVPSNGLAQELKDFYPFAAHKVYRIYNPVDTARFRRPADFDREDFRARLGLSPRDLALAFVALGHFERKGLPLLLDAFQQLQMPHLKLVVVGGVRPSLITSYQLLVKRMDLEKRVIFVGMQKDVRPFLWALDAFVFPSNYEGFSLAFLQAAAAGLPPMVTCISGAEEFIRDGENGILIDGTLDGVRHGFSRLLALPPDERILLGTRAQQDVQRFDVQNYIAAWRSFYAGVRNSDNLPLRSARL